MTGYHNVVSWLDKKIDQCIAEIDQDILSDKNIKILDALISIRKKYDGSLDQRGERIRVMEEFIQFTINFHPKELARLEKICKKFLESS